MYDFLIVGGGPAGVSAALTAYNRNRSAMIISNPFRTNPLSRAQEVTNYPGVGPVSGAALLEGMYRQLKELNIPIVTQRAVQMMRLENRFACAVGADFYEGRTIILATGMTPRANIRGEAEYLGKGLSYCATCDGMLFRGKRVAVVGLAPDAAEEANFLASIGCSVYYFHKGTRPAALEASVSAYQAARYQILGDGTRVNGIEAEGFQYEVDGVFILRESLAADSLLAGVTMSEGHIVVDKSLQTSVQGAFAAGDCIGKPYQVAKAVGDGNVAALAADAWLREQDERS